MADMKKVYNDLIIINLQFVNWHLSSHKKLGITLECNKEFQKT